MHWAQLITHNPFHCDYFVHEVSYGKYSCYHGTTLSTYTCCCYVLRAIRLHTAVHPDSVTA